MLTFLAFLIPFLISGPQLLTGTLVNAVLYLFALKVYSKKFLIISLFPSIGAVLNGVLFGSVTPALLGMLPFIWMGNLLLIQSVRLLMKSNSHVVAIMGSAVLKSLFMILISYTLYSLHRIPQLLLSSMGLFQLITSVLGGGVAFGVINAFSKKQ